MTYKEFSAWCNDRACDGQWGMKEAIACIDVIKEINSVKAPGFHLFKDKANAEVQEEAWRKLNAERHIEEIFVNGTNDARKKVLEQIGGKEDV